MVTFAHTYEPIRAVSPVTAFIGLCYNSIASSNIRHLQTANKPTPYPLLCEGLLVYNVIEESGKDFASLI